MLITRIYRKFPGFLSRKDLQASPHGGIRAVSGLLFGLLIGFAFVKIFTVNSFDFDNMQTGIQALAHGSNPWAEETRLLHFYNPPFSVVFLWPLLFTSPQFMIVIGFSFLSAFLFYQKSWVAASFFATNSFLFLIAAGGIDMFAIGGGLLFLAMGDRYFEKRYGLLFRVLAYGMLMVKPQGGIFIVVLYILVKRDWAGLFISLLVYGLPFARLFPDWLRVLRTDPPLSQTEASHSLYAKFGPILSICVAVLVTLSRRWKYWQLGGALAGILAPYGMPAIPIFLTLTAVNRPAAIPAVIVFSGCLAALTWLAPESPLTGMFMGIYHLGMLGIGLLLACLVPSDDPQSPDRIPSSRMTARLSLPR